MSSMFPHSITIYHHSIQNGTDAYTKDIVRGVYWYGRHSVHPSGRGSSGGDAVTIITSMATAATRGTAWNVEVGDRVILGEGGDITALSQISGGITVTDIEDNRVGASVDNITILGV